MTDQALAKDFSLHRRYYRSVNLERDFDKPEVVQGYILTERSLDALQRIMAAFGNLRANRAWTMIGVYGAGKSAFAHYLTALCAPADSKVGQAAWAIAEQLLPADSPLMVEVCSHLPDDGVVRAVAAGQREPLSWTLIRALINGIESFGEGNFPAVLLSTLTDWGAEIAGNRCRVSNQQVLTVLKQVVAAAQTHVLVVIDELGKNLEYAAQHRGTEDLYLLQQIAELRYRGDHQVYFLGLLHQSFAGYSERLSAVEQNEWTKIQGRFEPIQFSDSPSQMTRLIGQAITQSASAVLRCRQAAAAWGQALTPLLADQDVAEAVLASALPLHPLTAMVLPLLCTRYAQNDRSLFTFLTSDEPYGLMEFLKVQVWGDEGRLPTLKLHQLYDYFVEAVTGLTSRINLQRWVEIQSLIQDARTQDEEILQILKTVGILNLITATGSLKASPQMVSLALCDRPTDTAALKHLQRRIEALQDKGIITYRSQLDELRIWEGSDFNVEAAIYEWLEKQRRSPLAQLLSKTHPLKPLVAQRHYTTTGTLRYFEQEYADSLSSPSQWCAQMGGADGLIIYWLDSQPPEQIPAYTADGKPVIVVTTAQLDLLRLRAQHLQAIKTIQAEATELQTDGVARREVKHRRIAAERLLDDTLQYAFRWVDGQNSCWIAGQVETVRSARVFQAWLSTLCDRTYSQGLVLDNELINRRELTSQGAKARRELIEAMLDRASQPRLGLVGYGPEVAMYGSVLEATGIHRQQDDLWGFYPPTQPGLHSAWQAIAHFCQEAKDQIQGIDRLYALLEAPPYGLKRGIIPVLLVAVLLHYADDISVYKDGTFIPSLGAEHFEILVKDPARFAVKYVGFMGLRGQIFQGLEKVLRGANPRPFTVRNGTLLAVVKPLFQFVKKLPAYTTKTQSLNPATKAVLQAILHAQEPDKLLFVTLPQACSLPSIVTTDSEDEQLAQSFCNMLVQAIRELQGAYDRLLADCHTLLYQSFAVSSDPTSLREELRVRSRALVGQCVDPMLRRFTLAAVEAEQSDREWLEALLMIVADKPAESWADDDKTRFEAHLSELARKFLNVEALRSAVNTQADSSNGQFEARRLTLTQLDGQEINRVIWIDRRQQALLDQLVTQLLSQSDLHDNPQLQQALIARLAEAVLGQERLGQERQPPAARARPRLKKSRP